MTPVDIRLANRKLRANSLSATNDGGTEQIIYWTRIGRHMPLSWAQQRWSVAEDNLHQLIPDAVLVRISTVHEDRAEGLASIAQFIRSLWDSLSPDSRKVLVSQGTG